MNRIIFFIFGLILVHAHAHASVWASVNFDKKTSAAMAAAYAVQAKTEGSNNESVQKILSHYTSAEVATAGIFASKWLDRKALQNAGLFDNAEENFYYKRIYMMVSTKIMPKIIDVASLMIKHPDKALYWGPYLFKVCEQTKQLCMIFETVVANGKVSFQDVAFLAISDNLKPLFDLTMLGDVDWKHVFDDLVDFGTGISKKDLKEDLDDLMTAGGAIASAGGAVLDSVWTNSSKVGGIFHMKPKEIKDLSKKFQKMYKTFSDPKNIKDLLMQQIISTDSTGVANLFKIDHYNITNYISDYLHEIQGQYYTQRWYIYWRDGGDEHICSYSPPSGSDDILHGPQWYRVSTNNPNYVYNSNDYEQSLQNSEKYAGWSRAKCKQLNNNDDKYTYNFYSNISSTRIFKKKSGKTTGFAYAHSIDVYKTWSAYEEVYEELFDSQYDAVEAIQARFNAKLQELNCNEKGKHYYIGKGSKHYYTAADEAKLKGCASVSFQMECDEHTQLGEGNFSWKENGSHNHDLNEESHRYAMESTLSGGADYSSIDAEIQKLSDEVASLSSQISYLEAQNNELLAQIATASIEEAAKLRAQYQQNRNQLNTLNPQLTNAKNKLKDCQDMKQEMVDEYADELDGTYRIPAVMHELESAYGISWSDAGSWQGHSYIRHGNMPNIQGEIIFQADLTMKRKESHNWLIGRYHRAILAVHWTLFADYATSSIVEFMELDNSLSEKEKADRVNQKLRELMAEHPGCSIEPNYAYSQPQETADDEDAVHLLWVCDRLAIARDVDYRLSKIYAQLVQVEKFMRSRETLLDYLKEALDIYVLNGTGRTRLGNKSFRRWRRSAVAAAHGKSASDVLAENKDDDDV